MSWVCLWSFPGSWDVVMSWLGLCSWSMVISWVCGHLWVFMSSGSSCLLGFHVFWVFMSSGSSSPGSASSCLGWVCGHLLGLRSLSGSWSVVCPGGFCGHVRSVVIFWVCDNFLDRGLWSCLGWVCVHVLCLSSVMKCVHFFNVLIFTIKNEILVRFTERFHANRSVATTSASILIIIPYVPSSSKIQELVKSAIFQ